MHRLSNMCVGVALTALACFGLRGANAIEGFQISNPAGGQVRALVIGIDAYQHVRQLKGAVADAGDIQSTLKTMGVRDVTTLIDAQAERTIFLREIRALVDRTRANDLIFLSIAGHGTQEPERVKGSEPDGMENVFLLAGFEPTAAGSQQRILGGEFNHFIKQFEARGARVVFIADTCHGGGMARDIDPRAQEMSFRQVPRYTLLVDSLQPVTEPSDPGSELDLDRTAFLAAVDRHTKAPEVRIPGIEGLRGALSYAVSRALEGNADADRDGKVTMKELFENVRQVVYQLSDQRQNVVTMTSPSQSPEKSVVFGLTRGISLVQTPNGEGSPLPGNASSAKMPPPTPAATSSSTPPGGASQAAPAPSSPLIAGVVEKPIRLAALDGKMTYFPGVKSRDTRIETVRPTDNPDLIWDPSSHDVIAWGDVIAYNVNAVDLSSIVDRTAAIRALKQFSTRSPQVMRVAPDDRQHHRGQNIEINVSDVGARSVIIFNVSGDGTMQMLYPLSSDSSRPKSDTLNIRLRVKEPFGAEQIIAITSQEKMDDLVKTLSQLDQRRAAGQIIYILQRFAFADARIGSIGFFSTP
jgi:caspase domain-containing protein